jgi:MFS family permease
MAAIPRRTAFAMGAAQLVCWGISYYLIAPFGPFMAAELGWSIAAIHAGFSAALIVMGLSSAWIGRVIDRRGGGPVMAAGSLATALACAGLALARGPILFVAAWLVLGLAMRMTLYDAAFAALARLGGPAARRPIAQITLLGGLASTVFWPLGHWLAGAIGWRAALLVYAALALATGLVHRSIPAGRHVAAPVRQESAPPIDRTAAALYALIAALTTFLNSGMSAHMIGILAGLGVAGPAAVGLATLRGIGQSSARLAEVLSGARVHPLALGVVATSLLPLCFAAGLGAGGSAAAGAAFALLFGAGNGLLTIVRGTVPLVLFDPRAYGAVVGRLLAPSFYLSAAAPLAYALVIDRGGERTALVLSLAIAALTWMAAAWLAARSPNPKSRSSIEDRSRGSGRRRSSP